MRSLGPHHTPLPSSTSYILLQYLFFVDDTMENKIRQLGSMQDINPTPNDKGILHSDHGKYRCRC